MTAPSPGAPGPVARADDTLYVGALVSPILIFGGPYSNLHATQALRAEAHRLGIPPNRTLCTGDVVAYGGDPEETTALIRDWGIHVVRGNCEESLAHGADSCGCGFPEDSACDRLSRVWYGFALATLSPSSRSWMATLPGRIVFELAGIRVAAVHGSAEDASRFVFASTADDAKHGDLDRLDVDVVIAGHSGIPFAQAIGGRLWLNAGVIGQPANDGTPDGWYCLMDVVAGQPRVRFHRLAYPYQSAADAIRRNGLPEAYANALVTGLWPSCEILPPLETAARGRRLDLHRSAQVFPPIIR